ncbi:MAG: lysophospholipid acyltransferase family protein [Candidatus Hodarchaeales archaeon]|jgi:1-acyl-sn-glycerol-3-phosphate acyltransferase
MSETTSDFKYGMIRKFVQLGALFGYRLNIEGSEHLLNNMDLIRGGSIFAGNHESVIDAFLMGLAVPSELRNKRIFFLGKKSALWRNRFWGNMMDYFGVIPVKRRGNQEVIRKGINVLENKQALGIFPEGHIRYSRKELEGKVGVARFAFETSSPVVPVGIIGTDGILPYGGNWPKPGKKVSVLIGEPIFLVDWYDPRDMYDPYALRAATDLIMNKIRILSKGYGIPPETAQFLRCMEGVSEVITPPRWLLNKADIVRKWKKKKKSVTDSFDNWLKSVPHPKTNLSKKDELQTAEIMPKKTDHTNPSKKFLTWLDEQL